jgi:hypothetical protein
MNLGTDPTGAGFSRYYDGLASIMGALRSEHPGVFFEGCASGGMRMDLSTLGAWDGHFLSDNARPEDAGRIYEATMLRYLPGRMTRWVVLRPVLGLIPMYGTPLMSSPERVLVPGEATWEGACIYDVNKAFAMAIPGILGLSGDIAGLSDSQRQCLAEWIRFYASVRHLIPNSVGHLLMGPRSPIAAIELVDERSKACVLSICGLSSSPEFVIVQLKGLSPDSRYMVRAFDGTETEASGDVLMKKGIRVRFSQTSAAWAAYCEPIGRRAREIFRGRIFARLSLFFILLIIASFSLMAFFIRFAAASIILEKKRILRKEQSFSAARRVRTINPIDRRERQVSVHVIFSGASRLSLYRNGPDSGS